MIRFTLKELFSVCLFCSKLYMSGQYAVSSSEKANHHHYLTCTHVNSRMKFTKIRHRYIFTAVKDEARDKNRLLSFNMLPKPQREREGVCPCRKIDKTRRLCTAQPFTIKGRVKRQKQNNTKHCATMIKICELNLAIRKTKKDSEKSLKDSHFLTAHNTSLQSYLSSF